MFTASRSLSLSSGAGAINKNAPLSKLKDIAIYWSRGLERNINCSKPRKSLDNWSISKRCFFAYQALPAWVLLSAHLISSYGDKRLKPTTTKSLDLSVNEKTVFSVLKVLANFRWENVLTICNSSPPFWNYDQVEYVPASFGNFFFFLF